MKKIISLLIIVLMLCPIMGLSRVIIVPRVVVKRVLKVPKQNYTYYYFTPYNLSRNQTDSQPCIGASTKNLCTLNSKGIKTIALTVDVRRAMSIKWGDRVQLIGGKGCEGTYEVHDEMAKRFRESCIKRDGVCIKGDIVNGVGGVCRVQKL